MYRYGCCPLGITVRTVKDFAAGSPGFVVIVLVQNGWLVPPGHLVFIIFFGGIGIARQAFLHTIAPAGVMPLCDGYG